LERPFLALAGTKAFEGLAGDFGPFRISILYARKEMGRIPLPTLGVGEFLVRQN
jgi:hypothetical protein